jgi:1,4-dihydroxy-6-naphthoate synthase
VPFNACAHLAGRDAPLPHGAVEYAQQFGRGLDRKDTDRFVGMYVNQLTLGYGTHGRAALERFFAEALAKGLIPNRVAVDLV